MAVDAAYDPRVEVMHQLEDAYERLAEHEQRARQTDAELAEDLHRIAVAVLRGRMAEEDGPDSPPLPMHCLQCAAAYAAGGAS